MGIFLGLRSLRSFRGSESVFRDLGYIIYAVKYEMQNAQALGALPSKDAYKKLHWRTATCLS